MQILGQKSAQIKHPIGKIFYILIIKLYYLIIALKSPFPIPLISLYSIWLFLTARVYENKRNLCTITRKKAEAFEFQYAINGEKY